MCWLGLGIVVACGHLLVAIELYFDLLRSDALRKRLTSCVIHGRVVDSLAWPLWIWTKESRDRVYAVGMKGILLLVALNALGNDEYEVREHYQKVATRLCKAEPATFGPVVEQWCYTTTDAEISSRVNRIVPHYRKWVAESFVPRTVPVWPDIYMMQDCKLPNGCLFSGANRYFWYDLAVKTYGVDETYGWPYQHTRRHATKLLVQHLIAYDIMTAYEIDMWLQSSWAIENRGLSSTDKEIYDGWTKWEGGIPERKHK